MKTSSNSALERAERKASGVKRVLLLTPRLADTSAARLCTDLALRLDRSRVEPVVCCYAGWGELAQELEESGVEIFLLRRRPGIDPGYTFALAAEIRSHGIDLVHSLNARKAYVVGVLAGLLAGVSRGIASFHDHPAADSPLLSRAGRLCGEVVGQVVASSEAVRDSLLRQRWVPPGKTIVIPDGVDPSRFQRPGQREAARAHFGLAQDGILVGGIARDDDPGDLELLLAAFEELCAAEPAARMLVCGVSDVSGADRARIRYLGPQADSAAFFSALDHLCLPSADRSVPLALIEALAAGVPVTAGRRRNDEGSPPAGPWAFAQLVEASPATMAQGVRDLLRDGDAAESLARAGRACVVENHSMERHAAEIQRLYLA